MYTFFMFVWTIRVSIERGNLHLMNVALDLYIIVNRTLNQSGQCTKMSINYRLYFCLLYVHILRKEGSYLNTNDLIGTQFWVPRVIKITLIYFIFLKHFLFYLLQFHGWSSNLLGNLRNKGYWLIMFKVAVLLTEKVHLIFDKWHTKNNRP